jgi:hypothetical protein
LDWERLAPTPSQVNQYRLPSIPKLDRRYKPPRPGVAYETEALSQTIIQNLLIERLDDLLPEPLDELRPPSDGDRVGGLAAGRPARRRDIRPAIRLGEPAPLADLSRTTEEDLKRVGYGHESDGLWCGFRAPELTGPAPPSWAGRGQARAPST